MKRKQEAKREVQPVHFDRWQFAGRRPRAVSQESGIAFTDYSRMHVQRREVTPERRLPTPMWALKNEWLRELLVTYLEERFYIRNSSGTLSERLAAIAKAASTARPRKKKQLERFMKDYNILKTQGYKEKTDAEVIALWKEHSSHHGINFVEQPRSLVSIARGDITGAENARRWLESHDVRVLEIQMLNLDTDLVLTDKDGGAAAVAAVIYLYYRNGWDSVAVAEELGFKPPHIRQLLWRMNLTWKERLQPLYEGKTAGTDIGAGSKSTRAREEFSETRIVNAAGGKVKGVPHYPSQPFAQGRFFS